MTEPDADAAEVRGPIGLPPRAVDALVAVGVFGASVVNVSAQDGAGLSAVPTAGLVLLALGSGALVWRRRWPLAVLGVALVMMVAWMALDYPGNPVFQALVAVYSVGRYIAATRISLAALAVTLGIVGWTQLADNDSGAEVVTALMVTGLPWYVGRRLRIRGEHAAIAKEREELLEWERATAAERAVADARASIARELHDVVAHNVSVMTVQAGAARLLMPKDLDRAQEAIGAVEEAGRRALDELRHLLGVLRSNAVSDDLSPQPSLDQVPELVDQLRNAGMQISLASDVQSVLPDRVDLFGYRIVQEALTNVLKHGGRHATTEVRIVESDGHLDIEVTNTGTGTTSLPGAGQGLVGMQERAIMLGGTVEAGPRPGGGFGVRARLPIGDS